MRGRPLLLGAACAILLLARPQAPTLKVPLAFAAPRGTRTLWRRAACGARGHQRAPLHARSVSASAPPGPLPLTVGVGTCLVPNESRPPFLGLPFLPTRPGVATQIGWALDAGYRLIDTAQRYGNEDGIGQALQSAFRKGAVSRKDLFITTKVWVDNMGYDNTLQSVDSSLQRLRLDAVDLLLIHWPGDFGKTTDYEACKALRRSTWEAMEKLVGTGKVKHIGVANFGERHLKELFEYANLKPAVDQFEIHPYNSRNSLVEFCQRQGIQVNSYSPVGGRNAGGEGTGVTDRLLDDPKISRVAAAHSKKNLQVVLRWHLQRGITPIPKASSPERLAENFNVQDFELTDDEMAIMNSLNEDKFVVYDGDKMP